MKNKKAIEAVVEQAKSTYKIMKIVNLKTCPACRRELRGFLITEVSGFRQTWNWCIKHGEVEPFQRTVHRSSEIIH